VKGSFAVHVIVLRSTGLQGRLGGINRIWELGGRCMLCILGRVAKSTIML
jgi:hypothetical protein